jgi:hypothetical protein
MDAVHAHLYKVCVGAILSRHPAMSAAAVHVVAVTCKPAVNCLLKRDEGKDSYNESFAFCKHHRHPGRVWRASVLPVILVRRELFRRTFSGKLELVCECLRADYPTPMRLLTNSLQFNSTDELQNNTTFVHPPTNNFNSTNVLHIYSRRFGTGK